MQKMLLAVGLTVGFAVLALVPARAEDCGPLIRVASLDMLPSSGNRVVVPAAIDDKPLRMIVDTGGYLTALSETTADQLGLFKVIHPNSHMTIYGGQPLRRFVAASNFSLGRMKAGHLEYPLLPPGSLEPDIDGILSPDFLANFDLDFDFAGGKLNLFSKNHCDGKVGYWTNDRPDGIPIVREEDQAHISMHVNLDGKEVKAIIDTGAVHTLMSLEKAQDLFDIKDNDPQLKSLAAGVNRTRGDKKYPFRKLSFASVEVTNPDIILVPDSQAKTGPRRLDMIVGLSILRQLHLYIAYHEKMLYLTPASAHK